MERQAAGKPNNSRKGAKLPNTTTKGKILARFGWHTGNNAAFVRMRGYLDARNPLEKRSHHQLFANGTTG
jgi:hypothetical protein